MTTQPPTIDSAIAGQFLQTMLAAEESETVEELSKFMSEVMYLGFDPMNTLAAIMQWAKEKKYEKEMHKDILTLLRVTLLRGTKADSTQKSMFTRMGPEGRKKIEALIKKWNIVTNKHASSLGPYDVTLGRLIACFSTLVARILRNKEFFAKSSYANVPMNTYADLETPTILPEHLRFPGSNSLYKDDDKMQSAYMSWSRNFTIMINPSKKLTSAEEGALYEKSDSFAVVTRNSMICTKFGITGEALKQIVEP